MVKRLTEDEVNDMAATWLKQRGLSLIDQRKGTAKGDDIKAEWPNGDRLAVECKGYVSKNGKELHHWSCAAGAVFNVLRDSCQCKDSERVAIAVPDEVQYRELLGPLKNLLVAQRVAVLFIRSDGFVDTWGWPEDAGCTALG